MEQLGQVHFARKTLVPTLILRNSPKLSHQCFVAALQLATGVRFPHGSRLLFRQDLRLGGMLTRPRSAPGRDTISCPFICLCMYLCLCVSHIEYTWAVDADVVAVDKANWLSANSPSRRRHSAWLCRSCSEVCGGRRVVRWGSLVLRLLWLFPLFLRIVLVACSYFSYFDWSLIYIYIYIYIFAVWTWILIIRKTTVEKNVGFPGQKFNVALLTLFSGRVESLLHE